MALTDLCYRCPECGHDPMDGEGDLAWCQSCGVRIERRRGRLVMTPADRDLQHGISASILSNNISAHGGPMTRALRPDGTLEYSAGAMVSWLESEEAIWHRGVLLGFSESLGPAARGTVTVDREVVSVADGRSASGCWSYLELRAVQSTSSSLQLSLPGDDIVQLRFLDDSPRRWETLMRHLIRDAYERSGRGRVVELQPRIVTR